MSISGNITPRRDLSSEDYKLLGECIKEWGTRETAVSWLDYDALADLVSGEPPRPLSIRLTEKSARPLPFRTKQEEPTKLSAWSKVLGAEGRARSVPFALAESDWTNDRASIIVRLRLSIPAGLVEDIELDGASLDAHR